MADIQTKIVNFYESTLAALLASGATSGTLTTAPTTNGTTKISASSGDSSTHYYLVIDPDNSANREVILVTQSTDETLTTITRDVEGRHSTDPNHQAGTTVRLAVLAEHFIDMNDRLDTGLAALTGALQTSDLQDDDTFTSAAADKVASSESIKAYADTKLPLAGGTMTGAIVGAELTDYVETDVSLSSTSGVVAIDLANGNTGSLTLTENVTDIDFTNVPTNGTSSFTLKVTQDGTGSRTMAINAITVNGGGDVTGLTPGAAGLTLSTGAADIDLVSFLFFDAGTPLINSLLDFS